MTAACAKMSAAEAASDSASESAAPTAPASPTLVAAAAPPPPMDLLLAELDEALQAARGDDGCCKGHTVIFLRNGDVHLCKGAACTDVELSDQKEWVCKYSGVVVGTERVRDDFSTGRNAGSANPDDHAGEPVGGTWRARKDQTALSHLAYRAAESSEAKEQEDSLYVAETAPRVGAKRGARCVDATPAGGNDERRPRKARRPVDTREGFDALQQEAEVTMNRLVNFEKRGEHAKKSEDARLVDPDALFNAALKKYIKECATTNARPTLDAVHNLALISAAIVAEQKKRRAVEEGRAALLLKVRMRQKVTTLAVTLWLASCDSPYMRNSARRGADSYRPFVCGVLYALKRGVALADGTVVLPRCPDLAAALPALRATAANSAAKALHASSHRGLCTLHRSIASCDDAEAAKIYGTAARLAAELAEDVRQKHYDM